MKIVLNLSNMNSKGKDLACPISYFNKVFSMSSYTIASNIMRTNFNISTSLKEIA